MSLYTRIALVLCGMVIFSAALSAGLIFWRFDAQLVDAKLDDLERETEIQATRFAQQIDELTRDTRVLAGSAPVQGLVRALANQGLDPVDDSTLSQWRQRLAVNFQQTLRHKPDYLQMRFIGVADNGTEVVRVDRQGAGGAIRIVAASQLQAKADTAYFRDTAGRDPESVYLSPINLNREYGKIQQPPTPVIRAALPVRDGSGQVHGMVVINFGLTSIFQTLTSVPDPAHRYYLTNTDAQYLVHPQRELEFGFEFREPQPATTEFPLLTQVLEGPAAKASVALPERGQVVSVRRLRYGPADLDRQLGIIVTDSYLEITEITRTVIQQVGVAILVLLILGLLIGLWLAQRTTGPIMRVTESVRRIDHANPQWQRPDGLTTEARALARTLESAFDSLKQRSEQLDKSNRELQQFAYIASHDLQEPVRTISSFAKLLETQYEGALDERGRKYLHFVVQSCERMRQLIHGLLEYSSLGTRSVPQPVDLNETLAQITEDMQAAIQTSGARITIAELPTLNLFAVEVRLLFQNLLSNAIKYVPPGRTPVVDVACRQEDGRWLFTVTDNGLGIAEEHRDKVFLIFQRLQGRSAFEGTGIGLAHCRKVVELHHGRIWIESAPDGGSRFCFSLQEVTTDDPTATGTVGR